MAERVYAAEMNGVRRLVRAKSPAGVITHIAKNAIKVWVPSPEDMYAMGSAGVEIEETSDGEHQTEVGEPGTMTGAA